MKQTLSTKKVSTTAFYKHVIFQRNTLNKYCFIVLFGLMIFAFSSCQKYCDHHKKTYTIKGEFTTTATVIATHDTLDVTMVTGNGFCTPFGNANFVDTVVGNPLASPEIINGVETLTASDGDKVFSTVHGYSPAPDEHGNFFVYNTNTIIGGTGKYAGATGSIKVVAKGNIEMPTGTASYNGSITY